MFGVSELSRKKGEDLAFSTSRCFSSVSLNCVCRDGAQLHAQGTSRRALFSVPRSEEPNTCCPYLVPALDDALYFCRDLLSKGILTQPDSCWCSCGCFLCHDLGRTPLHILLFRIVVGLWSCLLFLWLNAGVTLLRVFAHSGTRHRSVREQPFSWRSQRPVIPQKHFS